MSLIAGNKGTFTALAGAVVLLGIADSMTGAYLVLFAAGPAGLSPVEIGLFTSAPAAGGIVIGTLAGRRFDRRPAKSYAIATAVLGALGFLLLTTIRSAPLLILVGGTLLAAGQAMFPQLFALSRVVLGGPRSTPLLRSTWSLAWALGPLAGAALLPRTGFTGLLVAAALTLILAAVATALVPAPATGRAAGPDEAAPATPPKTPIMAVAGVTLFFLAMFAGSLVLPLYVTTDLHRPSSAVGLLFSACAAIEIVAALGLAVLPERVNQRLLIGGGMVAMAAYYAITLLARSMTGLLVGQVARAVAIAVVSAAGIRWFQELMRPAAGRATTLFANATAAGSLLAGVLAGLAIEHWGRVVTLGLCGVVALVGAAVFTFAREPSRHGDRPLARSH
ncbi:MFS transporter [Actinoplanes sp. NPDC089786]|uniref:MFS transporter n=1 Tax=Actinoplanes sp. NPDC089786 TaxID=3155185 RepID=UPI00342FE2DB